MKDVSRLSDELVDALLAADPSRSARRSATTTCRPCSRRTSTTSCGRAGRSASPARAWSTARLHAADGVRRRVHGRLAAAGPEHRDERPAPGLEGHRHDDGAVVAGGTRKPWTWGRSRAKPSWTPSPPTSQGRRRVVTAALRPASGGSSRSAIDHRIDDVGSVRASSAPASRTTGRVAGSHRPSSALPLDAARSASDPTPDASRQLSPHSARTRWTAGRASIRSKCAWTLPGSGMSIIGAQRST